MPRPPDLRKPPYMITSVDHALRLIQMLRDNGGIGLTEAARELEVSPSTVHRMMAMLVYRGFAIRDADRRYVPGPAMSIALVSTPWAQDLRTLCSPHLELLATQVGETANLMIRIGSKVRFLAGVEVAELLRIGDRTGMVLEAHQSSGGKALLAETDRQTLDRLYRSKAAELGGAWMDDERYERFLRELAEVRSSGFATNREESETGIRALGFAIHDPMGRALAAISIAAPTFRSQRLFERQCFEVLTESRIEIEADIAASDLMSKFDR